MCVAQLCFFSKYLLHSQPTSSNPLNSPYRSGPVTLTVIEICRLRLLARIGWDSEPRDGLAGLPVVSGVRWRGKIGSRVRIWERQAGQGENTDTGSQFSGYFYLLHGSTSVRYKQHFMFHFKILSLLRASSSVPSTKNPSQCQCMNSRKNEEIGCWCSYLILRGWIPAPPRPLLLIPCGLAAVEGRPVNEEITINRFLSSLPQSSHGRVWNPTMIPAVLTRPILSQIIIRNYLVKLHLM